MSLKIIISIIAFTVCRNNVIQCVDSAVNSIKVDDLTKISYGWVVDIEEYPFMVSVQQNFMNMCGGVLIHPTWVLTSAACMSSGVKKAGSAGDALLNSTAYTVVAGQNTVSCSSSKEDIKGPNNPNRRKVLELHRHEGYDSTTDKKQMWHFIGLMTLESAFGEDIGVSVAYLVPQDFDEPEDAVAIGWGFQPRSVGDSAVTNNCPDKYYALHGIYVVITNRSYCTNLKAILLEETQLCVDESGDNTAVCRGDFGGPLILQDGTSRVIGILAYVKNSKICSANSMAVFTRVAKYRDWIDKFVQLEDRVPSTTSQLKPSLIYLIISIFVLLN